MVSSFWPLTEIRSRNVKHVPSFHRDSGLLLVLITFDPVLDSGPLKSRTKSLWLEVVNALLEDPSRHLILDGFRLNLQARREFGNGEILFHYAASAVFNLH